MSTPPTSPGRIVALLPVVLAALALAGCGGTKTSAEKSAEERLETTYHPPPRPKSITYEVKLGPFQGGDPIGSGVAIVSINAATNQLCWTISSLTNVPSPTEVRLFQNFTGASGRNGFRLGHGYKPSGCIPIEPPVLGKMELKPQIFFVNVHSARYPGGAVRGPLA